MMTDHPQAATKQRVQKAEKHPTDEHMANQITIHPSAR